MLINETKETQSSKPQSVNNKSQTQISNSQQTQETQNIRQQQETNQRKREVQQTLKDNFEKALGKTGEIMDYGGTFVSEVADKASKIAKANVSRARGPGEAARALKYSSDMAKLSNIASKVGYLGTAISAAVEFKEKLDEGKSIKRAATETAISTGSSLAGAWAGAQAGAFIGSLIAPGVGTVIGAGVGGIIGSIAGSELGSRAASYIGEKIFGKDKKP
ncbi:MAG: hypothetical protein ACK4GJ_05955 [bacterium]